MRQTHENLPAVPVVIVEFPGIIFFIMAENIDIVLLVEDFEITVIWAVPGIQHLENGVFRFTDSKGTGPFI